MLKDISKSLKEKLIKEGYLKNTQGFNKDVNISSIQKNSNAKTHWICEDVLFNYYYENNIECDDKYYKTYYANRQKREKRYKK